MPKTKLDDNIINVFVVVGCLIEKDEKYLLVQEKLPEIYGLWNLPAGKVEKGQILKEAATREAKEESGYDVEVVREIGIYHKDGEKSVKHVFEAKIIGGELEVPEDEILDAKWFSFNQILDLDKQGKIRNDWIIRAIEDYQKDKLNKKNGEL